MQLNNWLIKCNHTPETLDRIMMHFRKRGLLVNEINYKALNAQQAECVVLFDEDKENASRIYNNIMRTVDVHTIEIK